MRILLRTRVSLSRARERIPLSGGRNVFCRPIFFYLFSCTYITRDARVKKYCNNAISVFVFSFSTTCTGWMCIYTCTRERRDPVEWDEPLHNKSVLRHDVCVRLSTRRTYYTTHVRSTDKRATTLSRGQWAGVGVEHLRGRGRQKANLSRTRACPLRSYTTRTRR